MAFLDDLLGYDEITLVNPASALTDFNYKLNLNALSAEWKAAVQADGGNIRVGDGSNNQLPADLISYSAGSGLLTFKYSPASSGVQKIRIGLVGGGGVTFPADNNAFGADNAYASHCMAFYPSGGGNDRTVTANNLTMTGSPTVGGAAGPIDGSTATDYNGSSQYGRATASVPTAAPITILASANSDSGSATQTAACVNDTAATNDQFRLDLAGAAADQVTAACRGGGGENAAVSTGTYSPTTWHRCAAIFSTTTSRHAAIDGTLGTENTANRTPAGVDTIGVGAAVRSSVTQYFDGKLAFVQVHNVALSGDWIAYDKLLYDSATQANIYTFDGWTAIEEPGGIPSGSLTGLRLGLGLGL
jgi:hypothetical protein